MKNMKSLLALAILVTIGPLTAAAADAEKGFQPLFNGKDLTGWKLRNPAGHHSWTVLPGGILKNTVENGVHGCLATSEAVASALAAVARDGG